MIAFTMVLALAVLTFVYLFLPVLQLAIMAVDESLDAHEAGLALVASRNPVRETGPPANMAKLILLRQKIQSTNRKRRSSSHTRQTSRSYSTVSSNRPKASWMRFGRAFGGKQYH